MLRAALLVSLDSAPGGGLVLAGSGASGRSAAWWLRLDGDGKIGNGCPAGLGAAAAMMEGEPGLTATTLELTQATATVVVASPSFPQTVRSAPTSLVCGD